VNREQKILLLIFLSSFSTLAYEITLTRIFSISLWYHFAFMIVSIAMLGIGASGTFISLFPNLKNISYLPVYSLLLGSTISVSYLVYNQILFDPVKLSWDRVQLLYIAVYFLLFSSPFFFTGLIIATAFSILREKYGLVYGSDLLGAGLGSLGILILLNFLMPEKNVFILSIIALLPTLIMGEGFLKVLSAILIFMNGFFLTFSPSFAKLNLSPYKGLELALKFPNSKHLNSYISPYSRIDTFKSSLARFAPGLSLTYLKPLPNQIGVSIDGNSLNAITSGLNEGALDFVKFLPSYLPYLLGKKEDILILEPKGGLHVILAKIAGAKEIYKIESNPLLVEVIKNDYGELVGDIFNNHVYFGLGRSWLNANKKKFDIIDLSLMETSPSGSFGISEDYRFTVEAFAEYLKHLKTDGILSLNLFIIPPPRVELRLLATALSSMERINIKEPEKHIVAIRSWGSITIIIKKTKFLEEELNVIKKFSKDRRFDLLYYPGVKEEETNRFIKMPTNEYFLAFKSIMDTKTRSLFVKDYLFDISPVFDDKPFFNYYLKLRNIEKIYKIMGEKWQFFIEEGYILPAVFVQVFFLSLIIIILPAFALTKKNKNLIRSGTLCILFYFAFLGIGFMFVEISFIHKIILPLENAAYAVSTIIASILVSSGIGSLSSYKFSNLKTAKVNLIIAMLVIIYSLILPILSEGLSALSMWGRIVLVFIIFMPLGFFMGIPFVIGIKKAGEINNDLIPWAWAINGSFSVCAPIIAIMIAMSIGFKNVLWLGAASYLMAFLSFFLSKSSSDF